MWVSFQDSANPNNCNNTNQITLTLPNLPTLPSNSSQNLITTESFLNDDHQGLKKQILENRIKEIELKLEEMSQKTRQTEEDLKNINLVQERFIVRYQDTVNVENKIENLKNSHPSHSNLNVSNSESGNSSDSDSELNKLIKYKREIDVILQNEANNLMKLRTDLSQKHLDHFRELGQLHSIILDEELQSWKRSQALVVGFGIVKHINFKFRFFYFIYSIKK